MELLGNEPEMFIHSLINTQNITFKKIANILACLSYHNGYLTTA